MLMCRHAAGEDCSAQHAANGSNMQPIANGSGTVNGKAVGNDAAAAAAAAAGDRDSSFERKVRRAKRAARSELSVSKGEWRKWGYASAPGACRWAAGIAFILGG